MNRFFKIALLMTVCFLGVSFMVFGQSDDELLLNAIRANNTNTAVNILKNSPRYYNINPNYKFFEGTVEKSLLTKAIENQNLQVVQALVNRGATTDFGGIRTETPLMRAAKIGAGDIVQYLLEIGGDHNTTELSGIPLFITPLEPEEKQIVLF